MNLPEKSKIDNFLQDIQSLSPEKYEILLRIRKIFLDANPALVEDIKYGGLVFNLAGILMGGIFVYGEHMSIEFSEGAALLDPDKILEGKGKKRRHIKIFVLPDIEKKKVKYFVKQVANPNNS